MKANQFWIGGVASLWVVAMAAMWDTRGGSEASFGNGCLLIISAGVAIVFAAGYVIVRLVMRFAGWGGAPKQDSPERDAPKRNVRKELGKVKKHSDANMAALLQYIHDALRDGSEYDAISSSLLKKGWAENQVRAAFSTYQDMLARHPLPEKGLRA
jgi:hypothetical protein